MQLRCKHCSCYLVIRTDAVLQLQSNFAYDPSSDSINLTRHEYVNVKGLEHSGKNKIHSKYFCPDCERDYKISDSHFSCDHCGRPEEFNHKIPIGLSLFICRECKASLTELIDMNIFDAGGPDVEEEYIDNARNLVDNVIDDLNRVEEERFEEEEFEEEEMPWEFANN